MIRTPLRPLARILEAREKGQNPDAIERENLRLRHEQMREKARNRAEGRLLVMGLLFFSAFTVVGARMGLLAATDPVEPRVASSGGDAIVSQRADIVDREGRILATNLMTHALYAQPQNMIDPIKAAKALVKIFPDLDLARLEKDFTGKRKFLWIKRKISPEQMQQVHDIGDPGLLFGPREMRIYPNGKLAAHIMGGATFGREGVRSAEIVGVGGVEKTFDHWLRDPANNGKPLQLSLDLSVQAALEEVLGGGMKIMNAKGAAAVIMDANTGEVVSMASLPEFDPNSRPAPALKGDPSDSPLFNRAVQGVYELGSTFKMFTMAEALNLGLVTPSTVIEADPFKWGRFTIHDMHNYGDKLSVTEILVKSSNAGTARVAQMIGPERQEAFLGKLGLLKATPIELSEGPTGRPILPPREPWPEISSMTISYGHGLSASPLHLAAGYAALVNGGYAVKPTILHHDKVPHGPRVISEKTSEEMRSLMRAVVARGTATFADVPGYAVGGKTGTADKPDPQGGYYDKKVVSTFAGVFPSYDPKYVIVLTLDEPSYNSGPVPLRTAGWTAVPVAAEVIRRVAPLLGLRPEVEPLGEAALKLVRN